jgi:transcriptional regulator of NAD metabolism
MTSNQRRQAICNYLKSAQEPVTGNQLSEQFNVTRQVIVSDVALLRAKGEQIISTPQGYLYNLLDEPIAQIKIAAQHSSDHEQIRNELYLIVDNGATAQDVIVEHPLYGEITASLHISSRHDVDQFIYKLATSNAEPLLVLTEGLHLHTLTAKDLETLRRVEQVLKEHEFLASDLK